jgi:pimeloyl-ACP methyl ester carboxylesterase
MSALGQNLCSVFVQFGRVRFSIVSTPTSLDLPDGVERTEIKTDLGAFAALDAHPVAGVCERQPALLVPGYTGSKEDFTAVLGQLAAAGRRVLAIDMRGQYDTPGCGDAGAYSLASLGSDIAAVADAVGAAHLLGHSFGGLVARETMLAGGSGLGSLTLMSSGPAALSGPRAAELRGFLAYVDGHGSAGGAGGDGPGGDGGDTEALRLKIKQIWETQLGPQAAASGVPGDIVAFLRERMLRNCPTGLTAMARYLLSAPDRTEELAALRQVPVLVLYGEDDNTWEPQVQEEMAARLDAERICIPGATHSPAVEAPATTASALTDFWNAVEVTTSFR